MSHGNGYSCGMSLFEPLDPLGPSPSPSFRTSVLANSHAASESSRYSPWDSIRSGCSSISLPETTSSDSSINSHCYGRSPDDSLSVDSLINNLLQVVNEDVNGSSCDMKSVSTRNLSTYRCHNCTDRYCELCSPLRQTGYQNASTIDQFTGGGNSPLNMSSSTMINLLSPPPSVGLRFYCDMHRDAQKFYCQTCKKILCGDCGPNYHCGHATVRLREAIEDAGVQANQVMKEAQLGITALNDDLDAVQVAAESLDQKARQATADVMVCMRRIVSAAETREKELIARIEKARQAKYTALKARDEHLKERICCLSMTIDKLTQVLDAATIASNPLELLFSKDIASAEVLRIRKNWRNPPLPEESWISFTGGEGNIVHEIGRIGTVIVNNPGSIGDRRALKGRGSSPQAMQQPPPPPPPLPQQRRQQRQQQQQQRQHHHSPHHQSSQQHTIHTFQSHSHQNQLLNHHYQHHHQQQPSQVLSRRVVPKGRPIPLNTFPVSVMTGRNSLSSIPENVCIIGNNDETSNNLCRPWGISCDKDGHVIIADRSNNRIQIFKEDGTFVRRFGTHGTGPGQFDRPAGVAVDGRRRIIVADKDNHRIQILSMEGDFLLEFGEKGSKNGQFNYPWDVAVNTECQIVVTDTRNHRIQLFTAEGVYIQKYGFDLTPSMWKHFDSPRGIAFNPEGSIVTTDFNNHRVLIIDSKFHSAKILGGENNNQGIKQFLRPQGLVIDDEGNVIISDSRNHRIQVLDSAGKLKWKVGSYGKGSDEMDRPSGIALTPSGKIAVVDFGNNRVLIF